MGLKQFGSQPLECHGLGNHTIGHGGGIVALIAVGLPETWQTSAEAVQMTDIAWVVGSIVAYGILFTLRNGDFTWDLHSDSDVMKDGLALLIPLTLSLVIGALLFAQTGDWNIPDIWPALIWPYLDNFSYSYPLLGQPWEFTFWHVGHKHHRWMAQTPQHRDHLCGRSTSGRNPF